MPPMDLSTNGLSRSQRFGMGLPPPRQGCLATGFSMCLDVSSCQPTKPACKYTPPVPLVTGTACLSSSACKMRPKKLFTKQGWAISQLLFKLSPNLFPSQVSQPTVMSTKLTNEEKLANPPTKPRNTPWHDTRKLTPTPNVHYLATRKRRRGSWTDSFQEAQPARLPT